MKEYIAPEAEIIVFTTAEVIFESGDEDPKVDNDTYWG